MRRHTVIHLPPLSGEEASRLLLWLERASTAIWRAHGAGVLDYRLRFEGEHHHPYDDDDIPCFCPRHPADDDNDEMPW